MENEKENEKDKSTNKYISFAQMLVKVILFLLIIFIFGSWSYYFCKLSQLNILPNDPDFYPYTENKPNIENISVNINVVGEESEKIKASPDQHNTILDLLKKIFNSERTQSGIAMFFINILKEFFIFNMQMTQNIFSTMNSTLSESLILFFSPILMASASAIILFIDCAYLVYLWFANLYWIFKKNSNKDKEKASDWSDITIGEPVNFGLSVFVAVVLIIVMTVLLFIPIPIISSLVLFTLFGVLLTGLFDVCKKEGGKEDEKYTYLNSLSDNFKYHMRTMMIIITIFLILSVSSSFGAIYGGVVFLTSLLLYFKVIPIPIYSVTLPEKLTTLSHYDVANKSGSTKPTAMEGGSHLKDNFNTSIRHIKKLVKNHNK